MNDLRRIIQRLYRRTAAAPDWGGSPVARLPLTYQGAAQRLVEPDAFRRPAFLKAELRVSRVGLQPDIDKFRGKLLAEFSRRSMPFVLVSALRTPEEQAELFRRGVTRAKAGQSPHNFGCAVDLVHYSRLWDLTRREWDIVGLIGKEVARKMNLKVTWGGDFKSFYDPAHWELSNWKETL